MGSSPPPVFAAAAIPPPAQPISADWFRQHIRHMFADEVVASYIEKWLAWPIQNPHTPSQVVLVVVGPHGCGKSSLIKLMSRIIGSAHFVNMDESSLTKRKFPNNNANYIICTNHVPSARIIEEMSMRMCIVNASENGAKYGTYKHSEYFQKLHMFLDDPAHARGVYDFLLSVDLAGVNLMHDKPRCC